jgi:hypothetical protein
MTWQWKTLAVESFSKENVKLIRVHQLIKNNKHDLSWNYG